MDEDDMDDIHDEARLEARRCVLGFRPQKEAVHNILLPYSDKLDEESSVMWSEIKSNLAKSICLRELRPGFITWTARLTKYIKLYGFKFSKEDHVKIVEALLEVVTIPDLDPWMVNRAGTTLNSLLKKKELLMPKQDITIKWRPLYDLFERLMYSPFEAMAMIQYPQTIEATLRTLIRCCRPYFEDEATKEIMDEIRPLMCPFDETMMKALSYLEIFLPTYDCQHRKELTYEIWFDEIMAFWTACHDSGLYEHSLFTIFARLAEHNIGFIDWEPYVPVMFCRILKSFNLPVRYKQVAVGNKFLGLDSTNIAKWIVASLGPDSSTQKYLEKMFQSLESYYHTANYGRHSFRLMEFLSKLTSFFIRRLHRERYAREKWGYVTQPEKRLTDEQVTQFVLGVQPVVLHCMYSKGGYTESGSVLQNLATLRPEIVIPPIVERLYTSLETVTEPHKLTACMQAVVSLSRSLVYPGPRYKEGPTHVIPLLMATLPGIDPNDMRKAMMTFQFLSTFCTLVPLVDCSEAANYYSDLTEEERTVCGQSAQLEDFMVQFLSQCFALIESSTLEQTREETSVSDHQSSREETLKDIGMASTFNVILTHSSSHLYDVALKKVQSFVSGRILETKIAGRIAAGLCRCLAKVKPEKGLAAFVPNACTTIDGLLHDDIANEERLDDELKFNMLILSECVRAQGQYLLPYIDDIKNILRKTLHLNNKEGYLISGNILRHTLRLLTIISPGEYKSSAQGYDRPISECLYVREWGRPGYINNLQIDWHIPNEQEMVAAQSLVDEFLGREVSDLHSFCSETLTLTRDQLKSRLNIISSILYGCGNVLPFFGPQDSSSVLLIESAVSMKPLDFCVYPRPLQLTLNTGNVRYKVIQAMDSLQTYLLKHREDDTLNLSSIIGIYSTALLHGGVPREELDNRWKSFHAAKKVMENRLVGHKRTIRPLLIDRAMLQHESRLLERNHVTFTSIHAKAMTNMFDLATSHYSHVRTKAQAAMCSALSNFPYCYKILVDPVITLLGNNKVEDDDVSHEAFKGALYVILGIKHRTMLVKHDWATLEKLWPALISARHSEKPSIAKLMDCVYDSLQRYIDSFDIVTQVPDNVVLKAQLVLEQKVSRDLVEKHELVLAEKCKRDGQSYDTLVDKLCDQMESGRLHWRHYIISVGMITLLTRHDRPLPVRACKIMVQNLVHDNLVVRKFAIHVVGCILKQQKRTHFKVKKDSVQSNLQVPGDKSDNLWLCYDYDKRPVNQEMWDEPRYVHKTHHGYYKFRNLEVYGPSEKQPKLDRSVEEVSECEREIFKFFQQDANVAQLVSYLSLEEHKGRDKFDARRFGMFKGLFRNFGDTFLPQFKHHMERLVGQDLESSHRCAAEIMAGLIRGAKHWPWDKTSNLWTWLQPLIRNALNKITVESIRDWGTCFATASESRDPNRLYWMMEVLMEEPVRSRGSFTDCSRMYVLQGGLAQQEWRVPPLLHRLLDNLKPFLTHPYQNVRDRLGSMLTNIFLCDIDYNELPFKHEQIGGNRRNPRTADLINELVPQLEVLARDDNGDNDVMAIPGEEKMMDIMPGPDVMARMPGPEMMARMPGPEMMARMPGLEMMARMPGPEMMARMPGPEMMARMPGPDMLAGMVPGMPFPPPEMMMVGMPRPPLGPLAAFANGGQPLMKGAEVPVAAAGAPNPVKEEREVAMRLLQTVCKFVGGALHRAFHGPKPEYYKLLPMMCNHESNELNPHLARDCTVTLAYLADAVVPMTVMPTCLDAITQVAKSSSWKAKAAVLEVLQVTVFSNMPSILSRGDWVNQVMDVVETSLLDERLEVRVKAGQVLSGLVHCSFVDKDRQEKLLQLFYQKSRAQLNKKKKKSEKETDATPLLSRHSGILGLCAFVNAYPYDVPEFVPDILMVLSHHLHDPQPIPVAIKKTLQDFKRTHQDNWQDHKLKFSDDQLAVLTDLLVSPSYYA